MKKSPYKRGGFYQGRQFTSILLKSDNKGGSGLTRGVASTEEDNLVIYY